MEADRIAAETRKAQEDAEAKSIADAPLYRFL
jgi:hypothetical protein